MYSSLVSSGLLSARIFFAQAASSYNRSTIMRAKALAGVITAASKSVTVKSLVWSAPSVPPMNGWMAGMRWDTSPMSVDALK